MRVLVCPVVSFHCPDSFLSFVKSLSVLLTQGTYAYSLPRFYTELENYKLWDITRYISTEHRESINNQDIHEDWVDTNRFTLLDGIRSLQMTR